MTDLAAFAAEIDWPDHAAGTRTHDALAAGPSLGRLAPYVEWIAAVQAKSPPQLLRRARLVIFASDHGIAAAGVSAYPSDTTTRLIEAIQAGQAVVNTLADLADAGVRVVPTGRSTGRIDIEPALSGDAVEQALSLGAAVADEEIDAGADLLIVGNIGIGSTTSAGAIISVLTGTEPVKVVGRGGSGIDDNMWMHKVSAIRDARRRAWADRGNPTKLLAEIGGTDTAALSAFLLRAAARRTPVLLDGIVTLAAGLVAAVEQPRATRWWQAAQSTGEPAQLIATKRLDLEPMVDLEIPVGDGGGGLLALGLLRAALGAAGTLLMTPNPLEGSGG